MLSKLVKQNVRKFSYYRHRIVPENRFATHQFEDINDFKNYPVKENEHFNQKLPYHEIQARAYKVMKRFNEIDLWKFKMEDTFENLKLDDFDQINLLTSLEHEFHIILDESTFDNLKSVDDFTKILMNDVKAFQFNKQNDKAQQKIFFKEFQTQFIQECEFKQILLLDQYASLIQKQKIQDDPSLKLFMNNFQIDNVTIETWNDLQNFYDNSPQNKNLVEQQMNTFIEENQQKKILQNINLINFMIHNNQFKNALRLFKTFNLNANNDQVQKYFNEILVNGFNDNTNEEEFILVLDLLQIFDKRQNQQYLQGLQQYVNNLLVNIFIKKQLQFQDILTRLSNLKNLKIISSKILNQIIHFFRHCSPSNIIKYKFIAKKEAFDYISPQLFEQLYNSKNLNQEEQNLWYLDTEFKNLQFDLGLSFGTYNELKKKNNKDQIIILSQMACEYNDLEYFIQNEDLIKNKDKNQYFSFNFLKCLLNNVKIDEDLIFNRLFQKLLDNCNQDQQDIIYLVTDLKSNSEDLDIQILQQCFDKNIRENLLQQLVYIIQNEFDQDVYQKWKEVIIFLVDNLEMEDLFQFAIKIQTNLGNLFDFIVLDEDVNNKMLTDAIGYTEENQDAINEMEKRTSILKRGKSVFEPIIKNGFLTLCQSELNIKKKALLLMQFEEGKIQNLEQMKEAQKDLNYDAELDLRIVHDDKNNTFKDDFNTFYYKVQNGEFPVDEIFYNPKDILDIGDIIEVLINSLIKKNKVKGNLIPLLRYATFKKQTDENFQYAVRNLIDTNCEEGLKLVKKYLNLFKCDVPQMYERMKINEFEYAAEGFSQVENLDQKTLEFINGPFKKQIREDMKDNYLYTKIIEQNQLLKDSQEYNNFNDKPSINLKASLSELENYQNKLSYEIVSEEDTLQTDIIYQSKEEDYLQQKQKEQIQIKYDLINNKIDPKEYLKIQIKNKDANPVKERFKKTSHNNSNKVNQKFQFSDQIQDEDNDQNSVNIEFKQQQDEQNLNQKDKKFGNRYQKKYRSKENQQKNKSTIKFEDDIDDDQ